MKTEAEKNAGKADIQKSPVLLSGLDIPQRQLNSLIESGNNIDELWMMPESEFTSKVGSARLFHKLHDLLDRLDGSKAPEENYLLLLKNFGISVKRINLLKSSGLTLSKLVSMNPEELAEKTGVAIPEAGRLIKAAEKLLQEVDDNYIFQKPLQLRILELVQKEGKQSLEEIMSAFSDNAEEKLKDLDTLVQDHKLEKEGEFYDVLLPTLQEKLKQLDDTRYGLITEKVFSGASQAELAQMFGTSNQAVSRKVLRTLDKIGTVREDRYADIFKTWFFDKDTFCDIFKEPETTYYYLKSKYIKGKEKLTFDAVRSFGPQTRQYLKEAEERSRIEYKGHSVPVTGKHELIRELSLNVLPNPCRMDILSGAINEVAEMVSERDGSKAMIKPTDQRTLENYYASYDLINCFKKGYRYYPVTEDVISRLLDETGLLEMEKGFISTEKLYRDYPDLMKELDIRDEYELHNILKIGIEQKHLAETDRLTFARMPMIQIGSITKKEAVREWLADFNGVPLPEFARKINEEHGMKESSLISYVDAEFPDLISRNIIILPEEAAVSTEEITKAKAVLTKDVYTLHELENVLEKNNLPQTLMQKGVLRQLGYSKFTEYALSRKFQSAKDYLDQQIGSHSELEPFELQPGLRSISSFRNTIYEMEEAGSIFRISENGFIRRELFEQMTGMTPEDVKAHKEQFLKAMNGRKFVSLGQLEQEGFKSFRQSFGISELIYTSLFRNDKSLYPDSFDSQLIFSSTKPNFGKAAFLEYILEESGPKTTKEMLETLKEVYALDIRRSELLSAIRKGNIEYDSVTDVISLPAGEAGHTQEAEKKKQPVYTQISQEEADRINQKQNQNQQK